ICPVCCWTPRPAPKRRRGLRTPSQACAAARDGCVPAGAVPAEQQAVFDLVRGPRFGHEIPAHVVGGEDLPESVLVDRLAVSTKLGSSRYASAQAPMIRPARCAWPRAV